MKRSSKESRRPCVITVVDSEVTSIEPGDQIIVAADDMDSEHTFSITYAINGKTANVCGVFRRPATNEEWLKLRLKLRANKSWASDSGEMGDDSFAVLARDAIEGKDRP